MNPSISVIVTTYNWPVALNQVLLALRLQKVRVPVEIIVADDGSKQATADLIAKHKENFPFPLHHVWQPDEGFQAAKIRNRAIVKAAHEYIIFLDGDCEPLDGFIANHAKLAEPGWFVFGNRILLNRSFSAQLLSSQRAFAGLSWREKLALRVEGSINRLLPLLSVPLGRLRKTAPARWKGVKTCNLGVWRKDLLEVNGLEERFTGWGFEDSDLVLRLQKFGVKCKDGRFSAPVAHHWHLEQDRSQREANWNRLKQTQQQAEFRAIKGVSQYLTDGMYATC